MNVTIGTNSNIGDEAPQSNDGVEAHADFLFNFAIGQVGDMDAAEDLVQETFLAALGSKSSFSGKSSQRTWLVGILRHKIFDHFRDHNWQRAMLSDPVWANNQISWKESALWLHDVVAECHSPSRRMELEEFRETFQTALGKLPPRIAQVFQLYAVEELPNHEVCEQLNISEHNLWTMLHRGRKQLREHLRILRECIR